MRQTGGRERAVEEPRAIATAVRDAMRSAKCTCGAAVRSVSIDHTSGSVTGRCAKHEAPRPQTTSERRLRLALIERELRS